MASHSFFPFFSQSHELAIRGLAFTTEKSEIPIVAYLAITLLWAGFRRCAKQTAFILSSVIKSPQEKYVFIENNFSDYIHPTAKKQDEQKQVSLVMAATGRYPATFTADSNRIYKHLWIIGFK